jgi:hypothetical protein
MIDFINNTIKQLHELKGLLKVAIKETIIETQQEMNKQFLKELEELPYHLNNDYRTKKDELINKYKEKLKNG